MDINKDLLDELRARAQASGRSLREELNRALTRGLHGDGSPPYRTPTARMHVRPGINLDKALALADALEDEETARRLAPRQ